MDIRSYLESGNLELYAMGLLSGVEKDKAEENIIKYPELRAELDKIELSLEKLATAAAIEPPRSLIDEILNRISVPELTGNTFLPLLSSDSDYRDWQRLVRDYIPGDFSDGCYSKVIRETAQVTQILLVSSTDFDDEIHTDLHESFLILQGKCKCTVGNKEFFMEAGDYTEIPLHEVHRVEIVRKPVIAILQRIPV
ncbi:cupin domain-containing protein [Daejeonella sp. JGW-45]|uniref:cupin domain-containing protein n=1 Tax=Daejeonella sp. JGW-45 TaxID=3034148 RepID=UPI0023EB97C2|nr:cupin domain-containing protein [Daejeonella sp. JGW-45]